MGASRVFTFIMCWLDGTIGAFPGAKPSQQMRLDSICAAVRVVGLQGRAKTFSNVWLFDWLFFLCLTRTRFASAMVNDIEMQWRNLDEHQSAALDGRKSVQLPPGSSTGVHNFRRLFRQ